MIECESTKIQVSDAAAARSMGRLYYKDKTDI